MDTWDVVYVPWAIYLAEGGWKEEDKVATRTEAERAIDVCKNYGPIGKIVEVKLVEKK